MPIYKDTKAKVHQLDDAAFEYLLPDGCVEITEAEAEAIRLSSLTPEQVEAALSVAVQDFLDGTARSFGYDDIRSAVTYAEEPSVPKFQVEGRALRAWRSKVWAKCYQILDDVKAEQEPIPTDAELIRALPPFTGLPG